MRWPTFHPDLVQCGAAVLVCQLQGFVLNEIFSARAIDCCLESKEVNSVAVGL